MEEFLLVDDDFCGNCSNNLNSTNLTSSDSPKIYNLDIVVHTVKENKALSVACEKVSVFTAIKDLLSCQFQSSETYNVTDDGVSHKDRENYHKSNEHSNVNVQVPLCLPCSLLLQDLYRSFKLFQSLRDGASYISKLTHRIQQTFPISDVRNSNDADSDAGIQFDEYENNESKTHHTSEDQFEEEITVEVNPFETVTRASLLSPVEFIVDTGTGIEDEVVQNSNGVHSVSVTGTYIKTEMGSLPPVNDLVLTTIMQEEIIQAADLGIIEDDPLSLIECQENSTSIPFIQPQTRTTIVESATDSIFSGLAEFNEGNNATIIDNDDDGDYNPRLSLFNTKSKKRSKSSYQNRVSVSMPSQKRTTAGAGAGVARAYRRITSVYRCKSCKFASTSKHSMQTHEEKHFYNTAANANNNVGNRTNNSQKKFQCKFCPYKVKESSNLIRHERVHTGEKPYACPWPGCSARSNHSSNLKQHMRAIHKTRPRNTAQLIEECLRKRVTVEVNRPSIRNHNQRISGAVNTSTENSTSHAIMPNTIPSAIIVDIETEIETTSVRNLDADIAVEAIDPLSLSQYEDHSPVTVTAMSRSRLSGTDIEATSSFSSEIPVSAPTIKPKLNMYNCDLCNFTTSKPHFYRNHKQNDCAFDPNYTTSVNAVAEKCKNPNRLTANTRIRKPGTPQRRKIKCKYCNFQGASNNIATHERSHTGEKPFACQWDGCLFRAAHVSNLKRHMNNHSEDKEFFCSLCPYSGKDAVALKSHQKRCHPELFPI